MTKEHWLHTASKIMKSDLVDLKELAAVAGFNPKTFYKNVNLQGADFSGQDVNDLDFGGADLRNIIVDENTRINIKYWKKTPTRGDVSEIEEDNGSPGQNDLYDTLSLIAGSIEAEEYESAAAILKISPNIEKMLRKLDKTNINLLEFYKFLLQSYWSEEVGNEFIALLISKEMYQHASDFIITNLDRFKKRSPVLARLALIQSILEGPSSFKIWLDRLFKEEDLKASDILWLARQLKVQERFEEAFSVARLGQEKFPESPKIFRIFAEDMNAAWFDEKAVIAALNKGLESRNRRQFLKSTVSGLKQDRDFRAIISPLILQSALHKQFFEFNEPLVTWFIDNESLDAAEEVARDWIYNTKSPRLSLSRMRAVSILSKVCYYRGDAKEAADILLQEFGNLADPLSAKYLSDGLMFIGRSEEAIRVLYDTTERFPEDVGLRKWLVEALISKERHDEAQSEFRRAFEAGLPVGKRTRRKVAETANR